MQKENGKKGRNDRIFVVPDRLPFEADLSDIRRLPRRAMKELERFFEATDALEDKQLEFLGWGGASKAIKTIEKYSVSRWVLNHCRLCPGYSSALRGGAIYRGADRFFRKMSW
jgi:inorganic pyrophosphatase